jgi:hypothetical protein
MPMSNIAPPLRFRRGYRRRFALDIFNTTYVTFASIPGGRPMRPFVAMLALFAALAAASPARPDGARAQELVMIEREGCMWCARWKADIGPIYNLTPEGRRAPLRIVDVTGGWPGDLAAFRPERMTPSFLLLRDGVEIGRIRGYPGEDFFWGLLGQMLGPEPTP